MRIAKKYSKIFFSLIKKKDQITSLEHLKIFSKLIKENNNFGKLIFSPAVPLKFKLDLTKKIEEKLTSKLDSSYTQNLIITLVRRSRINMLDEIIVEFEKLLLKQDGFTNVRVFFASKPDKDQLASVEMKLRKDYNLRPSTYIKIDKSLVAGFIAMFDGKMLDASLLNTFKKLENFKIE